MESLIIGFLIFVIALLIVVIFVPAQLERLAKSNTGRRDEFRDKTRQLERDVRRYERLLAPYKRTRATVYQNLVAQASDRLVKLSDQVLQINTSVSQFRCPEVYGFLLPAQHFILRPEDIGRIASDTRRVKSLTTGLARAEKFETNVRMALEALAAVPQALTSNQTGMTERLLALEAAVDRERADGIEALDDFLRDGNAIRLLLEEVESSLRPEATLADLDGGALALQSVEVMLNEAEARLVELQREKVVLDRRLRRVTAELDGLQVASKSGPAATDLVQIRPLTQRAAILLNESAQGHRRRREFNAAGADVSTAAQLVNFGRDLNSAELQVRALATRDDGSSLSEVIAELRRDLDDLLHQLDVGFSGSSVLGDTALAGRAAQLRTRAETLTRRQDDLIAALSQEAATTRDNLSRGWEQGQALLRLSDEDPIARRYSRLLYQFEEAQDKPAALEQFRQDARTFEETWGQWMRRVQETGKRIARLRSGLLGLIDEALGIAEPWNCLREDVIAIQQRAIDFETLRAKFPAVRFRREAESIMDRLETIDADIESRFTLLKERARRLKFLESDVEQIVALVNDDMAILTPDDPRRARWERTLRLVDHHIRSAHAALLYEDASVALLRAADTANKQAL